jgi:hypothetical protein
MPYMSFLIATIFLSCSLGCRQDSNSAYVQVHSTEEVAELIGFTYEIADPPDYKSEKLYISKSEIELIALSDSGERVLCLVYSRLPMLWNVDSNTIEPIDLGRHDSVEIDFYGIQNDGRAIGVVDHQLIVRFSVDRKPEQIAQIPAGFYANEGVNSRRRPILAGDWLLLHLDNVKGNRKVEAGFIHHGRTSVWNLTSGKEFDPRSAVDDKISWFQVEAIAANGELLGTDYESAIAVDSQYNVICEVKKSEFSIDNIESASFAVGNDAAMYVGHLECNGGIYVPFVWSKTNGIAMLNHDPDKYRGAGSFLINDNALICAEHSPYGSASETKIWLGNKPEQVPILLNDAATNRGQYYFISVFSLANDNSMLAEARNDSRDLKVFLLRPKTKAHAMRTEDQ